MPRLRCVYVYNSGMKTSSSAAYLTFETHTHFSISLTLCSTLKVSFYYSRWMPFLILHCWAVFFVSFCTLFPHLTGIHFFFFVAVVEAHPLYVVDMQLASNRSLLTTCDGRTPGPFFLHRTGSGVLGKSKPNSDTASKFLKYEFDSLILLSPLFNLGENFVLLIKILK